MKKGIDVAKWQGDINWNQVSSDGVEFAILKITNKSNNAENSFESNYIGAKSVDMPIDVYNYTYASNVAKIKEDANAVVRVLNGRELGCKVWLDIENELQKGLGVLLIDMANEYKSIIEANGYEFGIYTGLSFYNSYIRPYGSQIDCLFWIARYPSNAQMTIDQNPSDDKMPNIDHELYMWQYSSKGSIDGISGNVDMNILYVEDDNKIDTDIDEKDKGDIIIKQPVDYKQYDSRWKNIKYDKSNGHSTIGSAGCGTTCSAMVLATLVDSNITPVETSAWSLANGYKYPSGGTYYSYFVNQFNVYNIPCKQLNTVNLITQSRANSLLYHNEAKKALEDGNLVIACMGKGNWTKSGHYILLYKYENGYVYINDPASKKASRLKNTFDLVCKQVKYWWTIEVPNKKVEEVKTTYKITATNAVEDIAKMEELKSSLTQLGMNVQVEKFEEKVVIDPILKINPYVKPTRTLMFKSNIMNGEDVKWLQWELGITCDGLFGNGTKTALKKYQAKHGLTVDGICGTKTIASLSAN